MLPEVATILRNTVTTTQTLEGREAKLNALFQDIGRFSATAERFLDANGDNLIRLGELGRAQLRAPRQVRAGVSLPARRHRQRRRPAGRGLPRLHPAHRARDPAEPAARLRAAGRAGATATTAAPTAAHLPNPPWNQANPVRHQPDFVDGVDEPTGKGTRRAAAGPPTRPSGWASAATPAAARSRPAQRACSAPTLGATADDVPDLGVLLVGPMARGATVTLGVTSADAAPRQEDLARPHQADRSSSW